MIKMNKSAIKAKVDGELKPLAIFGDAPEVVENIISDKWDASKSYAVGDYCIHHDAMWKCKVANTGQEPVEGEHWTRVSIAGEIKSFTTSSEGTITCAISGGTIDYRSCHRTGNTVNFSIRQHGISSPANVIVATLPEGFRPNKSKYIMGSVYMNGVSSAAFFMIHTNGSIALSHSSSTMTQYMISGSFEIN